MTIALSFLDDLFRVRIDLSALTDVDAVLVERALLTADPPWETVRGGVALPVVTGAAQLDDFEYGDAVLNHYRITRVSPEPGLQLTGTSGDYASTPDDAALDIVGDIGMQGFVTPDQWASGAAQVIASKWDEAGDQRSYKLVLASDGKLELWWSTDGTAATVETVPTTNILDVDDGDSLVVLATLDVDDGTGQHVVRFWSAPSSEDSLTLIEARIFAGVTSIHSGTAPVEVGASDGGTVDVFAGVIGSVVITSDPFGTPVEVANPDFAAQSDGATNFVDAAGRTWAVNGNAEILSGEPLETDSITPDNGGRTILKSIKYPALNRAIADPDYRPVQMASRTGVYNVKGRVPPIAVHDAWTSQWWTIETVTESLAEARDLGLCIQASGTIFVQVPPETENECFTNPVSGMPGGYVMIQNATMTHAVPGSHVMRWVLPVRIVVPPAPEIVGTTITWEAVRRIYGSWTALWASNATWRDLWNNIMDPDDAIAL